MKFGKLLQGHSEAASAGRRSMFLDYKKLKKLLNGVQRVGGPGSPAKHGHAGGAMSVEEAAFVDALNVSPPSPPRAPRPVHRTGAEAPPAPPVLPRPPPPPPPPPPRPPHRPAF